MYSEVEMYIETNQARASVKDQTQEETVTSLIILLIMTIVLDIMAIRWGADTRDGFNSLEWIRRQEWYGFH
jgi:hypothetical protein